MKKSFSILLFLLAWMVFLSADARIINVPKIEAAGVQPVGAISGGGGEAEFTCTSGDLLPWETFDTAVGAGEYDEGVCGSAVCWTESAGTVDPNFTAPAATGFNGECLRTYTSGDWGVGTATVNLGADNAVVYIRFYVYVAADTLEDTQYVEIATTRSSATFPSSRLDLYKVGAQLNLRIAFPQDGYGDTSTYPISTETSYLVEIYLNNTLDDVEWKVDGNTIGTDTSCDPGFPVQYVRFGMSGNEEHTAGIDVYFDNIGVSSTGYLGACL